LSLSNFFAQELAGFTLILGQPTARIRARTVMYIPTASPSRKRLVVVVALTRGAAGGRASPELRLSRASGTSRVPERRLPAGPANLAACLSGGPR